MSAELKPVHCGCGGEAKVFGYDALSGDHDFYVNCTKCGICTPSKSTEAEAIEAWNTAMGTNTRQLLEVLVHDATDTNVGDKERTAKVVEHDASVTDTDGYKYHRSEYLCGACKKKVLSGDDYCSHCGVKLDWSENERFDKQTGCD